MLFQWNFIFSTMNCIPQNAVSRYETAHHLFNGLPWGCVLAVSPQNLSSWSLPAEQFLIGRTPVSRLFFLHPKAEACKSIEYAMRKCPNGMFSEIKYDGERVQVHKNGDHFSYFSRSLKPVLPHKVRFLHFYQDCLSLLLLRISRSEFHSCSSSGTQ